MNRKTLFALLGTIFMIIACSQKGEESILVEDFDSGSFGNWSIDGNAFGEVPAGEGESHQMNGFIGSGFACSSNSGAESSVGTLTSPLFKIEKNSIHFLIGAQEIHFPPISNDYLNKLSVELLVENKVVRSKIPSEFHALFWEAWDVEEFIGKTAQFRIEDEDPREWAHIDVDQIIQNNFPVSGQSISRKLVIDKPVLNFPVKHGAEKYYLELVVDGKQVRAMDIELAIDEIDYWVVADLSPWIGKELTVRTKLRNQNNQKLLDRIVVENTIVDSENLYNESLQQQFHFSSKRGWLNDPNGLVYYDGEFHLFYQHNPYGWDHSRNDYNKTWGYATSTDLVQWNELPGAVHPDHLGPIYSGSAVIDYSNTTGFQNGEDPPMVCIYTSAGGRSPWSINEKFTQSLTYSTDGGRTFTKYSGNPVQENLGYLNRDPKAFWYEPDKCWIIVMYLDHGAFVFFKSKDLKEWREQSRLSINELGINEIAAFEDCPELFELPVDGNIKNIKWVLYAGSGDYVVGNFNGKKFVPESRLIKYNYGNAFYASQTFNNVPASDGRRIQIAWGLTDTPGMPFNQSLLFPVNLTLRSTEEGIRMSANPVEEIKNLYSKEHKWNNVTINSDENLLSDIKAELLDIEVEFSVPEKGEFGFKIKGKEIKYNSNTHKLFCDEEEVDVFPIDNKIKMRLLVDRLTIELFVNDGQIYMPIRAYPEEDKSDLQIFTNNGELIIYSLKVNELKSIWN